MYDSEYRSPQAQKSIEIAGLRLGYSVAREDLTAKIASYKVWINTNTLKVAAGWACFDDQEFIARNTKQNKETRTVLSAHELPSSNGANTSGDGKVCRGV